MPNPIGDLLLEALGKSEMTQAHLCTKTGYSAALISGIISGRISLTIHNATAIYRYCKHFDYWKAIDLLVTQEFEKRNLKPPKR